MKVKKVKAPKQFKPKNISQLAVGMKVRIICDGATIRNVVDLTCCPPGSEQVISRIDLGNNYIYCDNHRFYVTLGLIDLARNAGDVKVAKFGKHQIEEIAKQGGNQAIRSEMTNRVAAIRNSVNNIMVTTPENLFKPTIKAIEENIRQLKMLDKSIQK